MGPKGPLSPDFGAATRLDKEALSMLEKDVKSATKLEGQIQDPVQAAQNKVQGALDEAANRWETAQKILAESNQGPFGKQDAAASTEDQLKNAADKGQDVVNNAVNALRGHLR